MIGTIVLVLVVLAVLYFLWVNNKLNLDSVNESSPQLTQSSDSVQVQEDGRMNVRFNQPKMKNLRVSYGENSIAKVVIAEKPMTYNEIIDMGNKSVSGNSVFIGVLNDPTSAALTNNSVPTTSTASTKNTANFTIKQFKNLFIIFKGVDATELKVSANMARYESEGMVYCLLDANSTTVPDVRDVSYPIMIVTNNQNIQLKLKEWGYTQINDAGTVFVKNEKSFRLQ